jgi:hypothetical protein
LKGERTLRAALAVVIAVLWTSALRAADIDYRALADEHAALKDDQDVLAYLGADLKAARRFEMLEQLLEQSLLTVRDAKQNAEGARRQRKLAMLGLLSGMSEMGRSVLQDGPDPTQIELEAARAREIARDTLVELVIGYREIKAAAVDRRRSKRATREHPERRPTPQAGTPEGK